VVSRLAIDRLRSAQVQREHYVGPWLAEPVAAAPGPDDEAVLAESLTLGFLAVLERVRFAPEPDRHAARRPVRGRERVARFLVDIARRVPDGIVVERTLVNGEPGVVVTLEGQPQLAMAVRSVGGEIVGVWAVLNPAKLARLEPRQLGGDGSGGQG
jgi:hypothetical protein